MSDPASQPDPSEKPKDEIEAYELDAPPTPAPRSPAALPQIKPDLGKESLLDDFDEDADFDRDPEVERVLNPNAASTPDDAADEPPQPREFLVTVGRGEAEIIGGIGGLLCVVAMIVAAASAEKSPFAAALYTGMVSGLYVLTGAAALAAAAHLQGLIAGRWALAGARLLLAVALFQVLASVRLPPLGALNGFIFAPLGIGAYVLAMWYLFRWPRQRLIVVAACHAALTLVVHGLLALYAALAAPGSA